ncbi:hypothetical protein [Nocardioides sp. LHG3406-4]|uniref:hypothetical protein n=1 Tax=Nocardioides sp. LHG3406-4 TaxID=2804575 RepID=UPI003CF19914
MSASPSDAARGPEGSDRNRHILVDSVFDDRERMPTYWGAATIGLLWMIGTFGLLVSGPVTWWPWSVPTSW